MRVVVQRVARAQVALRDDGAVVGSIARGFLILLGVSTVDTEDDAVYLASKVAGLRVFEDADGKMNLALADVDGELLVVSQFTLYGDCRKGRRPGFAEAARPEDAGRLYEFFVELLRRRGFRVRTGAFQRDMAVESVNDGPVTLIIDSARR
ncbi:MAG TPA: D-tyrosyl-tRNA(Tyr) deacylase [Planctomycetaceae bacterium]|nr:D-tyrosyl-tRNA(Tyr) deacylase [Planctomycetaceae bacterium]